MSTIRGQPQHAVIQDMFVVTLAADADSYAATEAANVIAIS